MSSHRTLALDKKGTVSVHLCQHLTGVDQLALYSFLSKWTVVTELSENETTKELEMKKVRYRSWAYSTIRNVACHDEGGVVLTMTAEAEGLLAFIQQDWENQYQRILGNRRVTEDRIGEHRLPPTVNILARRERLGKGYRL